MLRFMPTGLWANAPQYCTGLDALHTTGGCNSALSDVHPCVQRSNFHRLGRSKRTMGLFSPNVKGAHTNETRACEGGRFGETGAGRGGGRGGVGGGASIQKLDFPEAPVATRHSKAPTEDRNTADVCSQRTARARVICARAYGGMSQQPIYHCVHMALARFTYYICPFLPGCVPAGVTRVDRGAGGTQPGAAGTKVGGAGPGERPCLRGGEGGAGPGQCPYLMRGSEGGAGQGECPYLRGREGGATGLEEYGTMGGGAVTAARMSANAGRSVCTHQVVVTPIALQSLYPVATAVLRCLAYVLPWCLTAGPAAGARVFSVCSRMR